MKTSEIMVGDWVNVRISTHNRKNIKVEDIYGDLFNATIWYGYEIQGGYDIETARPIPITEEFLKDNARKDITPDEDVPNGWVFGNSVGMIWENGYLDFGLCNPIRYVCADWKKSRTT